MTSLIDKIKDTNIADVVKPISGIADSGIDKIQGLSQENKDAIKNIKDALLSKFVPDGTIGSLVKPKAPAPSGQLETSPPNGKIPKFGGISWWDKTKNFFSRVGDKFGLKTHEITDDDYVWKPEKDKDGKIKMNNDGFQKGKYEFDWDQARKVDEKRGRATTTQFDPTKILSMGATALMKGKV